MRGDRTKNTHLRCEDWSTKKGRRKRKDRRHQKRACRRTVDHALHSQEFPVSQVHLQADPHYEPLVAAHCEISQGVLSMTWIPVTESLPAPNQVVLVYPDCDKKVAVGSLSYIGDEALWGIVTDDWYRIYPTHWQPLPEPPK